MVLAVPAAALSPDQSWHFDGFNVIATREHPYGSDAAKRSLTAAKHLGATTVAIIPFFWQASPSSPDIKAGDDMPDEALRKAIRQARELGFTVVVKPHVWVPESWAGAVELQTEDAWRTWFSQYRRELLRIAKIAEDEGAGALAIGTELAKTTARPEWFEIIAASRAVFSRTLLYVAHNLEEAEAVPFWPKLDAIGVSLYPPLGAGQDHTGRLAIMQGVADNLDVLSVRIGKPVVVGEIGLRSAAGATEKPWESAEERIATADPTLQAAVIADWLSVLNRPSIHGVLIWRWLTDPTAGGLADTDFTVQGKPAEAVLLCAWTAECRQP